MHARSMANTSHIMSFDISYLPSPHSVGHLNYIIIIHTISNVVLLDKNYRKKYRIIYSYRYIVLQLFMSQEDEREGVELQWLLQ